LIAPVVLHRLYSDVFKNGGLTAIFDREAA
jgi:hypothetical protein